MKAYKSGFNIILELAGGETINFPCKDGTIEIDE
jgi:hypothetical protein